MLRVVTKEGDSMNTKIKCAREKAGLTQTQVAEKAQIATRSYQRIEKGLQTKVSTAILIAKALNSTVEELF